MDLIRYWKKLLARLRGEPSPFDGEMSKSRAYGALCSSTQQDFGQDFESWERWIDSYPLDLANARMEIAGRERQSDEIRELADPDPVVRSVATRMLAMSELPDAVDRLVAMLADSSPMVRLAAAKTLPQLPRPPARGVQILRSMAECDESADVRAAAHDAFAIVAAQIEHR